MDDQPFSCTFGASLRSRTESLLGDDMAEHVRSIEPIADSADVGQGLGGWRRDVRYHSRISPI